MDRLRKGLWLLITSVVLFFAAVQIFVCRNKCSAYERALVERDAALSAKENVKKNSEAIRKIIEEQL